MYTLASMVNPRELPNTVNLPSGATQTFTFGEMVSPEETVAQHEAFEAAIAAGHSPLDILRLGAEHIFQKLSADREVTVGALYGELFNNLVMLNMRGTKRLNSEVQEEITQVISSPGTFLDFLDGVGLSDQVKSFYRPFQGKIIFEGPVSVGFAEGLGYLLTRLSKTGKRVLSRREPVRFAKLDQDERQIVGLLDFKRRPTVIKLTNSDSEAEVATYAGERSLGPVVYESTPFMIAEEWISGVEIGRYKNYPEFVGQAIGLMVRDLHKAGIVYDNRLLDHVMVERVSRGKTRLRIIDLESAGRSQNFATDLRTAVKELKRFYDGDLVSLRQALKSFAEAYKN